jgi:hypothetical protein
MRRLLLLLLLLRLKLGTRIRADVAVAYRMASLIPRVAAAPASLISADARGDVTLTT